MRVPERVDQPAELMRRRRETVQQQHRGPVDGAGLSVEDPDCAGVRADIDVAVTDLGEFQRAHLACLTLSMMY
jgi:hypothetical protein